MTTKKERDGMGITEGCVFTGGEFFPSRAEGGEYLGRSALLIIQKLLTGASPETNPLTGHLERIKVLAERDGRGFNDPLFIELLVRPEDLGLTPVEKVIGGVMRERITAADFNIIRKILIEAINLGPELFGKVSKIITAIKFLYLPPRENNSGASKNENWEDFVMGEEEILRLREIFFGNRRILESILGYLPESAIQRVNSYCAPLADELDLHQVTEALYPTVFLARVIADGLKEKRLDILRGKLAAEAVLEELEKRGFTEEKEILRRELEQAALFPENKELEIFQKINPENNGKNAFIEFSPSLIYSLIETIFPESVRVWEKEDKPSVYLYPEELFASLLPSRILPLAIKYLQRDIIDLKTRSGFLFSVEAQKAIAGRMIKIITLGDEEKARELFAQLNFSSEGRTFQNLLSDLTKQLESFGFWRNFNNDPRLAIKTFIEASMISLIFSIPEEKREKYLRVFTYSSDPRILPRVIDLAIQEGDLPQKREGELIDRGRRGEDFRSFSAQELYKEVAAELGESEPLRELCESLYTAIVLQGKGGRFFNVIGQPGVGKTEAVRTVMRKIVDMVTGNPLIPPLIFIEVTAPNLVPEGYKGPHVNDFFNGLIPKVMEMYHLSPREAVDFINSKNSPTIVILADELLTSLGNLVRDRSGESEAYRISVIHELLPFTDPGREKIITEVNYNGEVFHLELKLILIGTGALQGLREAARRIITLETGRKINGGGNLRDIERRIMAEMLPEILTKELYARTTRIINFEAVTEEVIVNGFYGPRITRVLADGIARVLSARGILVRGEIGEIMVDDRGKEEIKRLVKSRYELQWRALSLLVRAILELLGSKDDDNELRSSLTVNSQGVTVFNLNPGLLRESVDRVIFS